MTRFVAKLTNSAASNANNYTVMDKSSYVWLFVVAALISYILPWVHNSGTILQANAYDLAEWTSLHPTVQNGTPAFVETLLLRLQLLIMAGIVAFHSSKAHGISTSLAAAVVVGLIAIALLPPLEYFTAERGNSNYGQQFILAIITVLIGFVGLSHRLARFHTAILMLLTLTGLITSILAISLTLPLMRAYLPNVQVGIGSILMPITYISLLLILVNAVRR